MVVVVVDAMFERSASSLVVERLFGGEGDKRM